MILGLGLGVVGCTNEPTAQARCFRAVGELQAFAASSDELLGIGVEQMRDEDAVQKLQALSARYSLLLGDLDENLSTVPAEVRQAHEVLTGGVRLQQEAWISVEEGLRTGDTRDIFEGAELIQDAREQLERFSLVLPDCSDAPDT